MVKVRDAHVRRGGNHIIEGAAPLCPGHEAQDARLQCSQLLVYSIAKGRRVATRRRFCQCHILDQRRATCCGDDDLSRSGLRSYLASGEVERIVRPSSPRCAVLHG